MRRRRWVGAPRRACAPCPAFRGPAVPPPPPPRRGAPPLSPVGGGCAPSPVAPAPGSPRPALPSRLPRPFSGRVCLRCRGLALARPPCPRLVGALCPAAFRGRACAPLRRACSGSATRAPALCPRGASGPLLRAGRFRPACVRVPRPRLWGRAPTPPERAPLSAIHVATKVG